MSSPEGRSGRPVTNFIGCGRNHSVVVEGLPPPWISETEVPIGNPSPTSGARVAWVRCSPSQAAGRRRIAYVRPPRRSPLPAHQRAFQSSGDGVEWSMGEVAIGGDKFFGGMVNGKEMFAGHALCLWPPLTLPSPRLRGEAKKRPCVPDRSGEHGASLPLPASAGEGRVRGSHKGGRCQGISVFR